jgi:hypothetical protein
LCRLGFSNQRKNPPIGGLSNIWNISLTYLRGLEIAELKEEDMPVI